MKNKKIIIICLLVLTVFLFNKSVNAEEILYGDVDGDGKVTVMDITRLEQYLEDAYELNYDAQVRADVDKDNKITKNDSRLIKKYLALIIDIPVMMGDVNEDGTVDSLDADIIQKSIADTIQLTAKQKILADVNADGEPEVVDATIIEQYLSGNITSLPAIDGKPIVKDEVEPKKEEQKITPKEEVKEKNPKTGNNLYIYVIGILLISVISVLGTYCYHKKLTK